MYKTLRIIIGLVLILFATASALQALNGTTPGWIFLGLSVAYSVFSFGTLDKDEVGILKFFGKPIINLTPGPFFAPAFFFSVDRESGTLFQDELPANPENIFREEGKVPEGMFPPIRVKFGQPDPKDVGLKDDPYNIAMVAEVVPVVSWRIHDPMTFFTVMGTVEKCRQIMADKSVEVFGNEFATVTPAKALLSLGNTSERLEAKLKKEAEDGGWGIRLEDAYVKPFIFSHDLNKAVVGVKIADQAAKATALTADGEKQKRIKEAEGTAEGIKHLAGAERERLIKTGLARADDHGNIIELLPDATTKAVTDAQKAWKDVTGTLVVSDSPNVMIGTKTGGGR